MSDLRSALAAAARVPRLLVTSDFDGTLAPLVNNPADARALPDAVDALLALAGLPDSVVALISGRSLAVLTELSGAPAGVQLIGSHGAFGGFINSGVTDQSKIRIRGVHAHDASIDAHF